MVEVMLKERIYEIKRNVNYTWQHKKAFLKVEKKLLRKNTLRGYLHDVDKLFLYMFLSKETTSKIHHKIAKHHVNEMSSIEDYKQAMIDWECARYTKPDKPLDAYDTLIILYPHLKPRMLPLLRYYNLTGGR